MHVNNEIGTIQPLKEMGKLIKAVNPRTLFHVDGVQGYGKLAVDLKDWQVDLYSLSPHKLRGPRGVGLLYIKEGIKLFPLLTGGSHEEGQRAGTENVPAIVASSKAIRMSGEQRETFVAQLVPLEIDYYASCAPFLNLL